MFSLSTDIVSITTFVVVALLAIFTFSLIVRKVFKLALIFTFITIFAYYTVPDIFDMFLR